MKLFGFSVFLSAVFVFQTSAQALAAEADLNRVLKFAEDQQLHKDRQWRKLLHFETDFFRTTESQVDSAKFFFAPNGKQNPQAELQATIKAFFHDDEIQDSYEKAQCRFPARYRWLKKHLVSQNIKWPEAQCERYLAFAKGLKGQSVSLVFSSYYLNNPSSAFGHTFLRVNKAPSERDGKRYELLDYGLNYAAEADTNNAFLYGFKGLFGMFQGKFKAIPYYFKVREYNNAESRDLWEYQLRLKPEAVDMLVAHVWELGPGQIDYWYVTENCSYHMLSILEAADPSVDILSKLDQYVIPADTVRVLWNKTDLVESYVYRPSIRQVFFQREALLSPEESKELKILAKQIKIQDGFTYSENFNKMSAASQAKILDAFIDFIDYRYSKEVQEAGREFQLKMQVLEKRSGISEEPVKISIDPAPEERPHLAHPSGRWGVGYRHTTSDKDLALLSHRFALHDRLDPAIGYPRYSLISFFDLDFSYGSPFSGNNEKELQLENFAAFELISASAWSTLIPDHSWRFKLGVERTYNENFSPTQEAILRMGGGWTFLFGKLDVSAQVLGEAHYDGAHSENKMWVGAGPFLEAHYQWTPYLLSQASVQYRRDSAWDIKDYFKSTVETQYSFTKTWGLRGVYRNQRFLEEYSIQLFNYY
ncbi:Lnb N-terminal periplasmic domain-containing protein [Bdellovibrio svalbardensis]|uniref:DUF4105 domain-containing protein n=1 Tax=Bdellovibrio svalbardensis TaxID=2972972 RepID=A0ABT6DM56_9BACT|nr:DUF4105 domain-containing protein [Bdellovibrio svalbardensis]MDG0817964.1 DUF4105 domain-containing protein [Bdellovibrio svalbardensis]